MPPARLLIIRHGQSTWNAAHRWQGTADPPLSRLGEAQAREAAGALADAGIERVVTSPLRRARRTAGILSEALRLAEPEVVAELAERDVGDWTGLTRAEIEARWPGALDPPRSEPPGGETLDAFRQRVARALDELLVTHAGRAAAVVAHGGVIRAMEAACGVEPGAIPNLVAWWVTGGAGSPSSGERWQLVDPDSRNAELPLAP